MISQHHTDHKSREGTRSSASSYYRTYINDRHFSRGMQDTQSTTHKAKRGRLLPAASPSSYSTAQCTIPSSNNKRSREGESTPRKFKRGLTSAITLTPLPSTIPTTPIRLSTSPQSTDTNPRDGPYPSKI
jgi:hypothetical protein